MRTDNPEFWNRMFAQKHYTFGELPNQYFAAKLDELTPGKILLPGEGEGRNAVYSARKGWEVSAFDLSEAGRQKAEALAGKHGVSIRFKVGDVPDTLYQKEEFDCLALIFAQFMPDRRAMYHQLLSRYLKPGGYLIIAGHGRHDDDPVDMRYNLREIRTDFPDFEFKEAFQGIAEASEGHIISGPTYMMQVFAQKKE